MKKYLIVLFTCVTFSILQAQEIKDAIRYSQENLGGTARFRAMGGAFGALGGDLSSINVNPAGSAVFSNNQIAATIGNTNTKNNSNYFGTNASENNNSFDLNQAGVVLIFKNQNPTEDWKKFSLAMNYENTNNFDNSIFSAGTNKNNSIDNYFLGFANGIPLNVLQNSNYENLYYGEQQAFLGYRGYLINPMNDNSSNTLYVSNIPEEGNYYQENSIVTTGYNAKLSFNAATQYKDKLYLGINLNSYFTDFRQSSSFYEDNNAPLTTDYTVSRLRFDNELYTYGTGFSFQLGAIAKITQEVRMGLAYESPTWYHLNDELSQRLLAVRSNTNEELPTDVVDPQIVNIYDAYKLQTPSKLTGSFAYIFGKSGLISIDYTMKDYGKTKFKPENDAYYSSLNKEMNATLDNTSELRIGAEYKMEAWSLRAGYRFEQSPYRNTAIVGDLNGYSGGIGYNFGSTKLDLAYSYTQRDSEQGFFSQGLTDGAKINSIKNNISLSLLFEL